MKIPKIFLPRPILLSTVYSLGAYSTSILAPSALGPPLQTASDAPDYNFLGPKGGTLDNWSSFKCYLLQKQCKSLNNVFVFKNCPIKNTSHYNFSQHSDYCIPQCLIYVFC